jgi:predicted dehydrogenase
VREAYGCYGGGRLTDRRSGRRNGSFPGEAFAYRCHPQTSRLLDLLRDSAVGGVRLIDAVFGYDAGPSPANYLLVHELAGGSILDVGCYTTSMAHLVASVASNETVPTPSVAAAGRLGPSRVDHPAAATLVFAGGPIARVACSIEADLDSSVRICGSGGRITAPSPWLPGRLGTAGRIVLERNGHEPEVIDVPLAADVYTIEINAVNDAIRTGVASPS